MKIHAIIRCSFAHLRGAQFKVASSRLAVALAVACACGAASAARVSASDARLAALGWSLRGSTLGARIGTTMGAVAAHSTSGGATFYTVKTIGGGTVFMSGDTEFTPVLCFTSETNDFTTIDKEGPLYALLSADLASRSKRLSAQAPVASLAYAAISEEAAANANQWGSLIAEGAAHEETAARNPLKAILSMGSGTQYIDDVRVASFVMSRWSQSNVGGKACYNYWTPNGADPSKFQPGSTKNVVCGCVATAMSQIMRYHKYPTADMPKVTKECSFDGKSLTLTTQGGVYDWENMPLTPSSSDEDAKLSEVGKITSDAGISVNMMYTDYASGSGAYSMYTADAFKDTFAYRSAIWFDIATVSDQVFQEMLFTNFDAKRPVLMSIYGENAGGHAIVGDGYGFSGDKTYIHLNMGWSGSDDMWYNVPDMQTTGYAFDTFNGVCYNIFPEQDGFIVSGRLHDDEDAPVADAVVTAYDDAGEAVATATSDANGIYALIVPVGTYSVEMKSADGKYVAALEEPVSVTAANIWGNDAELSPPAVRIGEGEDAKIFSSLNRALLSAQDGDLVEILDTAKLKTSVIVPVSCTIVATNDNPRLSQILRVGDASLTITNGVTVKFSNVVFSTGSTTPVDVKAGGRIELGGTVDFNAAEGVTALQTAVSSGLVITSPLTTGFAMICTNATNLGASFGEIWNMDEATAKFVAQKISNAEYESGEVRGGIVDMGDYYALVWQELPVPVEEATAYFITADHKTNTSARIDFIFEKYEAATTLAPNTEIVIRKSGALKRRWTFDSDVTLTGELNADGELPTVSAVDNAGFTVTNGVLTIDGFNFSNYAGKALVEAKGEGCNIRNCTFDDILGAPATTTTTGTSGAIAIHKGWASVVGCTFTNCRTYIKGNCYGGAITLMPNASLALRDTSITGGYASIYGGGIYAYKNSSISLGGTVIVTGNKRSATRITDNIYISSTSVRLTVDDVLTGGTGNIGLNTYGRNKDGTVFAEITADMSADEVALTAQSLTNDTNSEKETLDAKDYNEGSGLMWAIHVDNREVDISEAVAGVSIAGEDTRYYRTLYDAFEKLNENGGTLELLMDCSLVDDITLATDVTITSTNDAKFAIIRENPCSITVKSGNTLTLANVTATTNGQEIANIKRAFLCADGGTIDLRDGTTLKDIVGDSSRAAGAVAVYNDGILKLNAGARIIGCGTSYKNEADGTGYGAVTVEKGTVELLGGQIIGGTANVYGGAIFAGNGSTVKILASTTLYDNLGNDGKQCNLTVSDTASLQLACELNDRIGVTRAFSAPTDVFGTVTAELDYATLTNSAAHFVNDKTSAYGVAVTNAQSDATLLVWSTAINEDGSVVLTVEDTPVTFWCVGDIPEQQPKAVPLPIAFAAIATPDETDTYTVTVTAAVAKCWYSLYETNSLAGGFDVEGVKPVERKQATEDGEITFTRPRTAESLFWRVVAEPEE